jgi:class 3 adenylate cyclase
MVQKLVPAVGQVSIQPPGILPDRVMVSFKPGLHMDHARLNGIEQPLKALFQILNQQGEPFTDSDGQAAPYRFGLSRFISVYAVPDELRAFPNPRISELLVDGRSVLFQLPSDIAVKIWRNWPSGFSQQDSSLIWLDMLFELAWQREIGTPLHVGRNAWKDNASFGLVGKGLFPRILPILSSMAGGLCPYENGYPRAFYSKIPDIARASISSIDEILNMESSEVGGRYQKGSAATATKQPETCHDSNCLSAWAGGEKQVNLVVTFTDIVGHSNMAAELGEEQWGPILQDHYKQARRLVEMHRGFLVKTTGDGVLAVFRCSVDALGFAEAFEGNTGHDRIRIRVGIHAGQVTVEKDDVSGQNVSMACRIMDKATNGGIWISDPVKKDVEQHNPKHSAKWIKHPAQNLKNMKGAYTLWACADPDGKSRGDSYRGRKQLAIRTGIVPRSMLDSQKRRLPGEVFAIELLTQPVTLNHKRDGEVIATFDRSGVEKAIITTEGKQMAYRKYVRPRRNAIERRDKFIHRFLVAGGKQDERVNPPDLALPLRWASGGILSIVHFHGKEWVPLFFRDIPPYGWNLALGSTERWFERGRRHKDCQYENELKDPLYFITREFLEELLVLDGDPVTQSDLHLRRLILEKNDKPFSVLHGWNFDDEHIRKRRKHECLNLYEKEGKAIMVTEHQGFCTVMVKSGQHLHSSRHGLLVAFSLLDLGIEVVKAVRWTLDDDDYLLDGEVYQGRKLGESEMVRMPIALVSCNYLAKVFKRDSETLKYVEVKKGTPPSIRVDFRPCEGMNSDLHLFGWDVLQRLNVVRDFRKGKPKYAKWMNTFGNKIKTVRNLPPSQWEMERYEEWYKMFGVNFVNSNAEPSCAQPSDLFVPGTAKLLHLFFKKCWKGARYV